MSQHQVAKPFERSGCLVAPSCLQVKPATGSYVKICWDGAASKGVGVALAEREQQTLDHHLVAQLFGRILRAPTTRMHTQPFQQSATWRDRERGGRINDQSFMT